MIPEKGNAIFSESHRQISLSQCREMDIEDTFLFKANVQAQEIATEKYKDSQEKEVNM